MSDVVKEFLGKPVRVYSNSGNASHTDDGTLEAADSLWIRIQTEEKETLCLPLTNIRAIKPIEEIGHGRGIKRF